MAKKCVAFGVPPELPELLIESDDWWIKPIEMLCHNWALIGPNKNDCVTVYFFHDAATTDPATNAARWIRVIDSLKFALRTNAIHALEQNHFMEVKTSLNTYPDLDWGMQPVGRYYYPHPETKGIYSSGEYWDSRHDKVDSLRRRSAPIS